MPGEKDDLMDAVGHSFGIQDQQQPTEQQDDGDSGGEQGQMDLPLSQPHLEPEDTGGQQQTDKPETGSDRHTPQTKAKDDQLFPDKPKKGPRGELLDDKGNIVASTRREKQLAYNLNRAQYAANQAGRDVRRLQTQLQAFQSFDTQIKQNNLTPTQVSEALQLRAMAEKDPILAVRDIVARVLANGVTMEQLFGNDAVPNINARVITNELDRRLGPVEQKARKEQQQEQLNERAQEAMETFVNEHPHADTHGVEISGLVANHGLTPERAYFELRSWVERRGFDFTAPLKPQIEAAMQRQRGKTNNGSGAQQQQRRSTPGDMRSVQPQGSVPTVNGDANRGDFKSNTPWRDIAASVFTELNNKR